jgi:hypothetical protein
MRIVAVVVLSEAFIECVTYLHRFLEVYLVPIYQFICFTKGQFSVGCQVHFLIHGATFQPHVSWCLLGLFAGERIERNAS